MTTRVRLYQRNNASATAVTQIIKLRNFRYRWARSFGIHRSRFRARNCKPCIRRSFARDWPARRPLLADVVFAETFASRVKFNRNTFPTVARLTPRRTRYLMSRPCIGDATRIVVSLDREVKRHRPIRVPFIGSRAALITAENRPFLSSSL